MVTFTDKDEFKLACFKRGYYFHVLQLGVQTDCQKDEICLIKTNGEVMTDCPYNYYINAQHISRIELAEMIRNTKPSDELPIFVVSIPEQPTTGIVTWCWMHLDSATTMKLHDAAATFKLPGSSNDPVNGFSSSSLITAIGTPRIYYDWREALTPIINFFKSVIKYCKDTGKTRRLAIENAQQALADRNETIRALVSKNSKRFKNIEF